jgi:hypothetical protein
MPPTDNASPDQISGRQGIVVLRMISIRRIAMRPTGLASNCALARDQHHRCSSVVTHKISMNYFGELGQPQQRK